MSTISDDLERFVASLGIDVKTIFYVSYSRRVFYVLTFYFCNVFT